MSKEKVLNILKEKHESSGGHCGVQLVKFEMRLTELKSLLNQLYLDEKITVHDSVHGKLIKLKL